MIDTSTNKVDTIDKTINESKLKEYEIIEELVMTYKTQFNPDATIADKEKADRASEQLLKCFEPLFKKYILLMKTIKMDFTDKEQKSFVRMFMPEKQLKQALKRKKITAKFRAPIQNRFNFIRETYGSQTEEEILTDLQILFFTLLKRYKQMGKNFCAYLYRSYGYEVARHIKKYTNNLANIPYRSVEYTEYIQSPNNMNEDCFEDKIYEDDMGIPDLSWISGECCSNIFLQLSNLERKLLIKYYLEDYNDRQIAEEFSMHINTVNQKRRIAIQKLAKETGIDFSQVKRNRKSGKKALRFNTKESGEKL